MAMGEHDLSPPKAPPELGQDLLCWNALLRMGAQILEPSFRLFSPGLPGVWLVPGFETVEKPLS